MSTQIVNTAIDKILGLDLPCEDNDIEVLCDECPFDILPKVDCGLAILQERANRLKLDRTESEESFKKCSKCGLPATHSSGLCRDCHQAILERSD